MLGIVLAAGEAARMPSKCLLPIKGSRFCVQSAIELCRTNCNSTVCVVKPGSLVETIVRAVYPSMKIIYQEQALGVWNALQQVRSNDCLVTFGDCVYDGRESVTKLQMNAASVAPIPEYEHQLDGWNEKINLWVTRSTSMTHVFLGWMRLIGELPEIKMSTFEMLNWFNAVAIPLKYQCWDIGSPESYRGYWDENHNSK